MVIITKVMVIITKVMVIITKVMVIITNPKDKRARNRINILGVSFIIPNSYHLVGLSYAATNFHPQGDS